MISTDLHLDPFFSMTRDTRRELIEKLGHSRQAKRRQWSGVDIAVSM